MNGQTQSRLRRVLQAIKQSIIQDMPAELEACFICRKTECMGDKWIIWNDRQVHAKCVEGIERKGKPTPDCYC